MLFIILTIVLGVLLIVSVAFNVKFYHTIKQLTGPLTTELFHDMTELLEGLAKDLK